MWQDRWSTWQWQEGGWLDPHSHGDWQADGWRSPHSQVRRCQDSETERRLHQGQAMPGWRTGVSRKPWRSAGTRYKIDRLGFEVEAARLARTPQRLISPSVGTPPMASQRRLAAVQHTLRARWPGNRNSGLTIETDPMMRHRHDKRCAQCDAGYSGMLDM